MTIFAVFGTAQPDKLQAAIAAQYPENNIQVGAGEWLLASDGTAKEVSDRLNISSGESGAAIIVSVSGYYGRAGANIWEWVKAKWGQPSG